MTAALPSRSRLSIGEVLSELRADFPDVTISKIRFLEAEGLVEPERTTSGYRKFSRDDMHRLRYILTAQRENYLPLKVIKAHLEAMDRGLEPPEVPGGGPPRVPMTLLSTAGYPTAEAFKIDGTELRLSRTELINAAGIDDALLSAIEGYGLVRTRTGSEHYDGDALLVAKTVAELAAFGLEPRHLRAFKTAADRQVGLFEQVVTPLLRQRDPAAKARAADVLSELAAASVRLHATLVKIGLRASS